MSTPKTRNPPVSRDPLTGLIDRNGCRPLLEAELLSAAHQHEEFGLILFDIDRFKVVNYGYGEGHGDTVLREVAHLAQRLLRTADCVSRWGGEEFLCLLPHSSQQETEALAARLREQIEALVISVGDLELRVTASLATAVFPKDGSHLDELLAACGAAMHHAKTKGRNRVVAASQVHSELYGAGRLLSQALHENRIVPAYQPIVDLKTGAAVGEEALARIVSPHGRVIPASAFIEAARVLQLTHQIDRSILMQAFAHCVATLDPNRPIAHFVNISGNLLRHPDVVDQLLAEALQSCTVCADRVGPVKPIVIEITERELLDDMAAARQMLKPFLDFGLRLALDDFGSGFSSYHYLADLPIAFLKIDGELIRRVAEPRVRTIVRGIQRTADELGITTLAEYVENAEIAAIVRDLGVHWGQGYHFGAPQVADADLARPHLEARPG